MGLHRRSAPTGSRGTQLAYHTFVSGILAIFVAGSDGTNPRRLTTPEEGDQMARWSPAGRQLVFQRSEGHVLRLFKIAADGSGETRLSTGTHHEAAPSWSPVF